MTDSIYDDPNLVYDDPSGTYAGAIQPGPPPVDIPTTVRTLRSAPTLSGTMRESPDYRFLGLGLTDRIFLVGHADGVTINNPFQVIDLQELVNAFVADISSPLLSSTLQCYKAGARDMWVMPVAPMVEYLPDQPSRLLPSNQVVGKTTTEMLVTDPTYVLPPGVSSGTWDTLTFYQRYLIRLQAGLDTLLEFEAPQILLPVEAPFYYTGGVDFVTPVAQHGLDAFAKTGAIRLAFLGSKIQNAPTPADIVQMATSTHITTQGEAGKFVSLYLGETIFNFRESETTYSGSPVHIIAGQMATLPANVGMVYNKLINVVTTVGNNLPANQIEYLAQAGVNTIMRTNLSRRGVPFQVVVATDNTIAQVGSDFWAVAHTRMIMLAIEQLRALGRRYLGEVGFGMFKGDVNNFFTNWVGAGVIRDFKLNISRSVDELTAMVDVEIKPYFGIRTLNFIAQVGPDL